jgi:hypothetical protein
MRRHMLLLGFVAALIPSVAVASPTIVGTWDVTGSTVVRYRYEGRRVRMNVPLRFTMNFSEGKTYRVSGIAVSCIPGGATLSDVTGRWRIAGGSVRGTAGLAGAIRDAVEVCVAGTHASVDTSRARFRVLPMASSSTHASRLRSGCATGKATRSRPCASGSPPAWRAHGPVADTASQASSSSFASASSPAPACTATSGRSGRTRSALSRWTSELMAASRWRIVPARCASPTSTASLRTSPR